MRYKLFICVASGGSESRLARRSREALACVITQSPASRSPRVGRDRAVGQSVGQSVGCVSAAPAVVYRQCHHPECPPDSTSSTSSRPAGRGSSTRGFSHNSGSKQIEHSGNSCHYRSAASFSSRRFHEKSLSIDQHLFFTFTKKVSLSISSTFSLSRNSSQHRSAPEFRDAGKEATRASRCRVGAQGLASMNTSSMAWPLALPEARIFLSWRSNTWATSSLVRVSRTALLRARGNCVLLRAW